MCYKFFLHPIEPLSDWARKYSDRIDFLKVVVDEDPSLLTTYPLTGVPTLLIYDEQKKLTRLRVGLEGFAEVEESLGQEGG